MEAEAEPEVPVVGPSEVEALGVVERLGVAVGRPDEHDDELARAEALAPDRHLAGEGPPGQLHRET